MRTFFLYVSFLLGFTAVFAQSSLVETQDYDNDLNISFKKYRLSNGLVFVLHTTSQFGNSVVVNADYHVGTSRDKSTEKGISAYMFEILKGGSQNFSINTRDSIYSLIGAQTSAELTRDYTRFQTQVSGNGLRNVLQIESDRLGYLSFSPKNMNKAQANLENISVQSLSDENILYPKNHPYYTSNDFLKKSYKEKKESLQAFKNRWYGANNVIISIAGNFKEIDAIGYIEKYFQNIKQSPPVFKDIQLPLERLEEEVQMAEFTAQEDQLKIILPICGLQENDFVAAEGALFSFVESIESPGRKKIINSGFARKVEVETNMGELSGEADLVFKTGKEGRSLLVVESLYKASKSHFKKYGVSLPLLETFKLNYKNKLLNQKESLLDRANALSMGELFFKNPNYLAKRGKELINLRPSQIEASFDKYFKNELYLPAYSSAKKKESWKGMTKYKRAWMKARFENEYKDSKATPMPNLIDRQNKELIDVEFDPFDFTYKVKSSKGRMKIVSTTSPSAVFNYISWYFPAGSAYENINNQGVSKVLAYCLRKGSKNRTTIETKKILEKLGMNVEVMGNVNTIQIALKTPVEYTNEALAVLQEWILEPALTEENIANYKKEFGLKNRYIDVNSLKEFYRTTMTLDKATMVYNGRLPLKTYKSALKPWVKYKNSNSVALVPSVKVNDNREGSSVSFEILPIHRFQIHTILPLLKSELNAISWDVKEKGSLLEMFPKNKGNAKVDPLLKKLDELKNQNFEKTNWYQWQNALKVGNVGSVFSLKEKQERLYEISKHFPKSKKYNRFMRQKIDKEELEERMNLLFTPASFTFVNDGSLFLENRNWEGFYSGVKGFLDAKKVKVKPKKSTLNTKLYKGKKIPVFTGKTFKDAYRKAKMKLKDSKNKFFYWNNKVFKVE
jgi:zinc protease